MILDFLIISAIIFYFSYLIFKKIKKSKDSSSCTHNCCGCSANCSFKSFSKNSNTILGERE